MAKKKKKQMRETLYCPYCKRPGVLRPAAYVYGDNNLDPEKYPVSYTHLTLPTILRV